MSECCLFHGYGSVCDTVESMTNCEWFAGLNILIALTIVAFFIYMMFFNND